MQAYQQTPPQTTQTSSSQQPLPLPQSFINTAAATGAGGSLHDLCNQVGCHRPKFVDSNGQIYLFCGQSNCLSIPSSSIASSQNILINNSNNNLIQQLSPYQISQQQTAANNINNITSQIQVRQSSPSSTRAAAVSPCVVPHQNRESTSTTFPNQLRQDSASLGGGGGGGPIRVDTKKLREQHAIALKQAANNSSNVGNPLPPLLFPFNSLLTQQPQQQLTPAQQQALRNHMLTMQILQQPVCMNHKPSSSTNNTSTYNPLKTPPIPSINASDRKRCALSTCHNLAYIDPQDPKKYKAYCSARCYWGQVSKQTQTLPTLLESHDLDYMAIHEKFIADLPRTQVLAIIRLQMSREISRNFFEYRKNLAITNKVKPEALTHRMFHGTKTGCDPTEMLCYNRFCEKSCGMCGIVREGNRKEFSRYAGKMWFAANSSISLSYCGCNSVKAMFVIDVVHADCGSIIIVDRDEATLPRYLIIFRTN
ncbi:11013_t:CDS:2 [Ambispora gerdemannii]|uniref:11013_t:CDS:1 n=1 Tax=Ambispora gerdemannii TaxID=144530 RepID=A0A9N9GMJ1_9GLOM|nr:11013_t:CDS:2 [Ambispora gerdemannii]